MKRLYQNRLTIFLFLLPALILFVGIIIIPIFMSVFYSLHDWNSMTDMKFQWFENYVTLFMDTSVNFPKALLNAVLFAAASVVIQLPLSLGIALLLARKRRGSRFFLSVFFIPVLLSTVVIGQLWLKIYNYEYGILNTTIRGISGGLESIFGAGFSIDSWAKVWLGDKGTVLVATFIPILWQYTGYHMLLMYAGVNSVPAEMQEAALIDGASEWQINSRIIIPMIKPVLRVCLIISVTGSLKVFDLIFILTGGGPAHASEVPSTLLYTKLFVSNQYGFGSSIAVILVLLCFLLAVILRKVIKTEAD